MLKNSVWAAAWLAAASLAHAQAPQPAAPPAHPAGGEHAAKADLPGPIDNLQDLEETARMVFKMADTNNDGQISQKEAVDVGNLLVGGFFFRADANGDGTISPEEARQARDSLLRQKPYLRLVLQRAKGAANAEGGRGNEGTKNPVQGLASLLDVNKDRKLEATEVRQAVQSTVQGFFAMADTNRDGQLNPTEINAAAVGALRTASQAAFEAADTDQNGGLSRAEFDKAITEPANMVFAILDADGDGQLSRQEIQNAERMMFAQVRLLRVPEPPNSIGRLIESGRTPGEVAPIPNIPVRREAARPAAPPAANPAPPPGQPR